MFVSTSNRRDEHMSNKYAGLGWAVGEKIRIISGVKLYATPESAKLIADYKNTILIEMKFVKRIFDCQNKKPRYVRQMIPKASLAVGDVKIVLDVSGEPLYGDAIASMIPDDECTWR